MVPKNSEGLSVERWWAIGAEWWSIYCLAELAMASLCDCGIELSEIVWWKRNQKNGGRPVNQVDKVKGNDGENWKRDGCLMVA